jgi:hypothetical protein
LNTDTPVVIPTDYVVDAGIITSVYVTEEDQEELDRLIGQPPPEADEINLTSGITLSSADTPVVIPEYVPDLTPISSAYGPESSGDLSDVLGRPPQDIKDHYVPDKGIITSYFGTADAQDALDLLAGHPPQDADDADEIAP